MPHIVVDATDFTPTPSQQQFLDATARVVAFFGGYGSGKSRGLAEKILDLAAANPGCDGLLVAPTWGILHKVTLRAFYDPADPDAGACPRELVAEYHAGKRYIRLVNDCRIYFGSADRPGTLEGANLAFFGLDEARLARQVAWKILLGRLRDVRAKRLQAAVVSTPLAGWLQEEFGAEKADRAVVHASTRENAHNLAPGFIEDLERTYSAREARVLIDGEFGLLVGAVLEEFERKTHLLDWKYDPRLRTVEVWDFGFRRPYVGWAQFVPGGWPLPGGGKMAAPGAWVIFDELVDENVTTEILAGRARDKGYQVDEIACDPAGDGTQSTNGLNDIAVLQSIRCPGGRPDVRFTTEPRWRHIPTGISLLRGMLRNARGEIRMYVAKALDRPKATRGVVKDFEGYAYPEAKDGRPVGDTPLKDGLHDHCLLGSEEVWVDENGWTRLDQLDGSRYTRLLTPAGLADARWVGMTRRAAQVFEVVLETGDSIVATGDHRFVVVEPGGGGRQAPGLSWRSLLEMRALLLAPDAGWRTGVSAPGSVGGPTRPDPGPMARPSCERGPFGQPGGEPRREAARGSPLGAHDARAPRCVEGLHGGGERGREGVARLARWQSLAPEAWARHLEGSRGPGLYLPRVWQALRVAEDRRGGGEVLPPELQDDGVASAARDSSPARVVAIREAGVADVWCASVPTERAFILRSGIISHNCVDAWRYFAVRRHLEQGGPTARTIPSL